MYQLTGRIVEVKDTIKINLLYYLSMNYMRIYNEIPHLAAHYLSLQRFLIINALKIYYK